MQWGKALKDLQKYSRGVIMPKYPEVICSDWIDNIKRKEDKITKEQAIQFIKSLPEKYRNVDNCYEEPYEDAKKKVIDLINRLEERKG